MTKGLQRTLRRAPKNTASLQVIPYRIKNLALSITDPGAAVGWGTAILGALPSGNLLFLGLAAYLQIDGTGAAGLGATFNATMAIGTAATAEATLSGAEVDLVAAVAAGAATAKLSPMARLTSIVANTGTIIDNTAVDKNLNLNVTVPDADLSATSATIVNGVVYLTVAVLGDD